MAQLQPPLVPVAIPNHIGRCVDFSSWRNIGAQLIEVNKQGYKITGITGPQLREDDLRYEVRSNFGNGLEDDIIFPREITNIYDCPAQGGRKARKARKSRKGRKASKRKSTRKH